tara:strand:- start:100 stop:723 length:624 start_codon:yes stop_codon:yes gene_type:complete
MEKEFLFSGPMDLNEQVQVLERACLNLEAMESRLNPSVIEPGERVFRDAKDTFDHITLGAVLSAHNMSAHQAVRIDGLLSMTAEGMNDFVDALTILDGQGKETDTIGELLIRFLDLAASQLEAQGRYATWRRAFDKYLAVTKSRLDTMTAEQLEKLRKKPVSKKQVDLVRYTCACHRLEFPKLENRGTAFEWLRDIGANPRYRMASL